jgi:ribonuclease HI
MEMMAAIVGLRTLKASCRVTLFSDSQYLVRAMSEGWAERWRSMGWRRNKKARAINADLWKELLDLCERHQVEFRWVKGHAGNKENERCDELSVRAAEQKKNLPADPGYEDPQSVGPNRHPLFSDAGFES